ncbi:hypothetical protein OCU04_010341 [Sclerotinia nivalis]|uniref:Uncharacterized protein n=1 Tax=Sclerotinia nivalis TaxID=352851 RepID=A0A9X0DF57_9HELO|nr:hypothetical protein OCU04_010341 [Sclerotinia nivalis]
MFEQRSPPVSTQMAQQLQLRTLDDPNLQYFMPFEEFTRYREKVSVHGEGTLLQVFENLLKQPGKNLRIGMNGIWLWQRQSRVVLPQHLRDWMWDIGNGLLSFMEKK